MATLDNEIEIEVTKGGDPWRNVAVGKPYLDTYANEWKIPVELVLAPNNVYADAVQSDSETLYKFSYTINFRPTADPYAEVVNATTVYPAVYEQEGETPSFHIFVPLFEDWSVQGMRGEAILSGNYPVGTAFQVKLKELDWELLTESWVGSAEQTIYLGEPAGGKFIVSVSNLFFEHKYIWWWGEEQTIGCYECTLGLVPGIFTIPVTVPNVLVQPIKKTVKQGETAEFTSADGLVEGKIYTFGIDFFHATDQAVNGNAYKFDNTTQEVFLVPVPGIGNAICPLLGIDPGTTECTVALADFIDPIYVANVFSKVLYHKDLAGNEGTPEVLDLIFVPLALASGIIPMGGMIKNTMGPVLKGAMKGGIVAKWLEKNKALIHAAGLTGDEADSAVALDRIKEAAKAAEGGDSQTALLEEAYRIMEGMVKDTKLTAQEVAKKQKAVVGAVTEKVDNVKPKSKTSASRIIEESGLENAAHVVPGIRKLDPQNVSVLRKVLGLLIGKRPALTEIEGELCELVSYSIREGKLTKNWKPFAPGFWGWLKRERLRATVFGAAIIMFPWWFADNLVFLIYILRYADVLDKTWGEQWKKAIGTVKDSYWDMQNFGPCEGDYQANYIMGIDTMRRLLEGANPIPEGKLAKAKYNLEVCYAVHIGDPNEFVKDAAWKVLNANELTYTKLVMGCEDPLIPAGGLKTPVIPNPTYVAKIERVVDGDTFSVSSTDPTWPFKQDKDVRLLGVDTPDSDGGGYYSVRRKVIPDKDAKEDPTLDVPHEAYKQATRTAQLVIEKQEVTLEIDLDNPYDTTPMQRVLATVWVDRPATVIDGVVITPGYTGDFGEKQLKEGNARVFFYTPNCLFGPENRAEYLAIEGKAKEDKEGLWGTSAPSMPKGKIHCRSAPSTAWVYLDDETAPKGDTETTISDVRIGEHTVKVRGTTACPSCSCDYDVLVKEDETAHAFCELSAIYEIAEVYWINENGVKETMYAFVHPGVCINQTSDVSDGCPMRSICMKPPDKIAFGRKYTTVEDYTPLEVVDCAAAVLLDLDFGKRRIELRQSGFKTMYEVIDIKHGMHVTRVAAMQKGDEEDYIEIGGEGPGKLQVTIYDGGDTLNYVKAEISLRNAQGAEVGRVESAYKKTFSDLNAGPDDNPYALTVTAEGFNAYTKEGVMIASGSTTSITVYLTGALEVGGEGTLHVTIRDNKTKELVRAHISVRNKSNVEQESITSDDTNIKLAVAGSPYTLQITHDDYHIYTKGSIYIEDDKATFVDAYLIPEEAPEPGKAILTILKPYYMEAGTEKPIDYAEVWLDDSGSYEDKFTGSISKLEFSVTTGEHTITLKAARFNNKVITLNISADHLLASQQMTRIHAATIVDPSTYPTEFNIGYREMCPITIVNTSDIDATFVVSQIFEGIDVIYTMIFPSREVSVSAGTDKTVNVPVTIPEEAIPKGMNIANYGIRTRLEVV